MKMLFTLIALTASSVSMSAFAETAPKASQYFSCVRPSDGRKVTSTIEVTGASARFNNIDMVDRDVPYIGYPSALTGWAYEYNAEVKTIHISFFADSRKPTRTEDQGTYTLIELESGISLAGFVCSVTPSATAL